MQRNNTQKKCLTRSLKEDQLVTKRKYMAFFFPPFSIPERAHREADKINQGNSINTNSIFI